MKRNKEEWMKAGICAPIVAVVIVALLMLTQTGNVLVEPEIPEEPIVEPVKPATWQRIAMGEAGGPATNVTGGSCVLNVSIVALGSNNYNANITYNVTDWYSMDTTGHSDITNNSHIGSNIPYSTPFEIQVKVEWNRTHAYNNTAGSSPSWMNDWVRGNCTCSGTTPAIAANTAMAEYNISGNTNTGYDGKVYYYYVMNNSGAGYQLSRGQNISSLSFSFDSFFA